MVKTFCDRCGREEGTNGEYDYFIKVLGRYDLCPECNSKYLVLLNDFISNKKQKEEHEEV